MLSVVYGYDFIGRLGVGTMEDLRARLLHAVALCRTPKWLLLTSRLGAFVARLLLPSRWCCLPSVGNMQSYWREDFLAKLVDPDLGDLYAAGSFGEAFKEYEGDRTQGKILIE